MFLRNILEYFISFLKIYKKSKMDDQEKQGVTNQEYSETMEIHWERIKKREDRIE